MSATFAQPSRRQGSSEYGGRRGERGSGEGRAARGGQTVPHDVADDQDGGVLRPLGDEVEVAADPLGGGEEGRGKLHARTLGKLGRGERIPDRAEVLKLVLGGRESFTQTP